MNYRFLLWRDKLLLLTLFAFFYAYSSPIRVALRSVLEGRDFSWGYPSGVTVDGTVATVSGRGLFGHTSHILFIAFAIIWLLCTGLRKPDRFFKIALVGWTSIGFGVGLWLALEQGGQLTSSKRTLGMADLSYFWTEVFPAGIAWAFAVALFFRRSCSYGGDGVGAWNRLNLILIACAAGFLGLAAILLNWGPQHGSADFNGVGMTYVGLTLFLLGVSPWEHRLSEGAARTAKAE